MTNIECEVISYLKRGYWLRRVGEAEGVSRNPTRETIETMVKKGTVKSLLERGLIYETINGNRFLLTDEGRLT